MSIESKRDRTGDLSVCYRGLRTLGFADIAYNPKFELFMTKSQSLKSICVFCGSSAGNESRYAELAENTGRSIGKTGYRFVYGGGSYGLMGLAARAAFAVNQNVLGIIPEFLVHSEGAFTEADHRVVPDMHVRKMEMYKESDAFIILPGGIGTIEEAVEVLSWMRLQLHQKPVIFLSDNNYWQPLIDLIAHTISIGFTPEWMAGELLQAENPEMALGMIEKEWNNPKEKRSIWVDYDDM